jgi:hypothetical protein
MQKRKLIVALAFVVAPLAASAASLSLDQLVACAGMTDPTARLACYDREVVPLARQVAGPGPASPAAPAPAPRVASPAPAAPPAAPPPSFGQEQLAREQRPAAKDEELALHARLSSQKAVGGGLFNLYLDNGQVWRHEDRVLGQYLKDGDAVTIEKGALGSYKLSRDAGKSRNWIRVSRVR